MNRSADWLHQAEAELAQSLAVEVADLEDRLRVLDALGHARALVDAVRAALGQGTAPRLRHWPLERLPLSCDALVLPSRELQELLGGDSRMARELRRDLRWLD
jgi:hypothetical protein